jgi:hypothetical protein
MQEGEMMDETLDFSDLLVQFERDNIGGDYRLFYSIKRNIFFLGFRNSRNFGISFADLIRSGGGRETI